MLQQPSLQVPNKGGRSRFSKALPTIPVPDANVDAPSLSHPTSFSSLDRLPEFSPLPSFLPEKDLGASSDSPLPSLPLSLPAIQIPTSGAPSNMAIPRRPVGRQPEPQLQQQPEVSQFLPPPEPLSPSDSFSSILSAYSRSTNESLSRTSEDKTADRESGSVSSPSYITTGQPSIASPSSETRSVAPIQRKPVGGNQPPPPPPSKDTPVQHTAMPVSAHVPVADAQPVTAVQPQIWRRRSISAGKELPSLQLDHSHGLTAAPLKSAQPLSTEDAPKSLPALPTPKPPLKGLPGRNIRPSAPTGVGAVSGEAKQDAAKLGGQEPLPVPAVEIQGSVAPDVNRANVHRPPTPEYRVEDVKSPVVNHFVTPVSPASSPEPQQKPDTSGTSAIRIQSPRNLPVSDRSANLAQTLNPPTIHPSATQDLKGAKSVPDMRGRATAQMQDPLPAHPGLANPERPASRGGMRTPGFPGDSRSSSARPDQRRPMEQTRFPPPASDPRLVYSEEKGYQFKGRDGTLYPEMQTTREPDERALYFPSQKFEALPEGSVLRACPIKESHHRCYQNHTYMNRRSNSNYPLTCQTCNRSDAEDRWVCAWCHVRLCESCLRIFDDNKRDLRRLMVAVNYDATMPPATATSEADLVASTLGIDISF